MSIKLLFLHKHEVFLSYCREDHTHYNMKYQIKGWYEMKKNESFMLQENDYIDLNCNKCNYKYKSETIINIYTTNKAHELYFNLPNSGLLYTNNGQQIFNDSFTYFKKDYYLIKNEYKGIIYIGNEKEIRDYFYSEMVKYTNLYNEEKSKNKSLNDDTRKKIREINDLN